MNQSQFKSNTTFDTLDLGENINMFFSEQENIFEEMIKRVKRTNNIVALDIQELLNLEAEIGQDVIVLSIDIEKEWQFFKNIQTDIKLTEITNKILQKRQTMFVFLKIDSRKNPLTSYSITTDFWNKNYMLSSLLSRSSNVISFIDNSSLVLHKSRTMRNKQYCPFFNLDDQLKFEYVFNTHSELDNLELFTEQKCDNILVNNINTKNDIEYVFPLHNTLKKTNSLIRKYFFKSIKDMTYSFDDIHSLQLLSENDHVLVLLDENFSKIKEEYVNFTINLWKNECKKMNKVLIFVSNFNVDQPKVSKHFSHIFNIQNTDGYKITTQKRPNWI